MMYLPLFSSSSAWLNHQTLQTIFFSKKIDHPTRRATGVIKYPLNDEVVGETTTDDDPLERRKSVQFDVVNIDELEIESEMPDDDPEEIEYESMENEEENSTDL